MPKKDTSVITHPDMSHVKHMNQTAPPSKEKEKNLESMQNDLLLPPWSKEWGKGGIKWVVLMEGISGMVKGVDASLGSFGKPWLDP